MQAQANANAISFDLGDFSLHGLVWGDATNKLVLCLHGWLDNAASFIPLAPKLQDKYVIAIDWPGHGLSQHRSADAHYHFVDYIYDLLKLFEVNQWQQVDIVGHSMGAMVASAFAAAFPEKVASLTLIDSIGFISANETQTTQQLRQGMLSRLKGRSKKKTIHPSIASAVIVRMNVSDLSDENARLIVERGLIKEQNGYSWRSDHRLRMTSPYRLSLSQAEQFIDDIKCPVQLIYGEQGHDMVNAGLAHFGPLFSQIEVHKYQGGHHVHMEQAATIAKQILVFIHSKSLDN